MAAASRSIAGELDHGALQLGIQLSKEQRAAFQTYIDTLLFWAQRLSLTGATSVAEIVRMHVLDSLSVVRFLRPGQRIADLGSGAGFPGVPIAITCPGSVIALIEPRRKRANFLREIARRCGLDNIEVIEARAQEVAAERAGQFDVVVSRAVWPVAEFLNICSTLLRSGGLAIAMKGPNARAEITNDAAFAEPDLVPYALRGGVQRVLVVYRKH